MIVSAKYVAFIMRADNRGEGGIMALLSLANKNAPSGNKRNWIMILGILGACMFYADGMITPAISVLSAIEGLEVVALFKLPYYSNHPCSVIHSILCTK